MVLLDEIHQLLHTRHVIFEVVSKTFIQNSLEVSFSMYALFVRQNIVTILSSCRKSHVCNININCHETHYLRDGLSCGSVWYCDCMHHSNILEWMQFVDIIVYIGVAIITIVIIVSATKILAFRYKRQLETLWGVFWINIWTKDFLVETVCLLVTLRKMYQRILLISCG